MRANERFRCMGGGGREDVKLDPKGGKGRAGALGRRRDMCRGKTDR
jgi:hypothetical protein